MFIRLVLFTIGVYLCTISLTFMIIYLNLLYQGYNILEYVNFIIRRSEVFIIIFGILFLYLSLRKGKKHDIHL